MSSSSSSLIYLVYAELLRYGGQLIVAQQQIFQCFYLQQTNSQAFTQQYAHRHSPSEPQIRVIDKHLKSKNKLPRAKTLSNQQVHCKMQQLDSTLLLNRFKVQKTERQTDDREKESQVQGPDYKKILRLSYDVIITYDNRKSNLR